MNLVRGYQPTVDQNVSNARKPTENPVKFLRRDIAAFHQQLAQPPMLFLAGAAHWVDVDFGPVFDEDEDVAHGVLAHPRGQHAIPVCVTTLAVEFFQAGDALQVSDEAEVAHRFHFLEQQNWIRARQQDVRSGFKMDPVADQFFESLFVGRGRRRPDLFCFGAACRHQLPQPRQDFVPSFGRYRLAARAGPQQCLYVIPRRQSDAHQFRGGRDASFPDPVESRLKIVCETGDVVESEHRTRTLNGV